MTGTGSIPVLSVLLLKLIANWYSATLVAGIISAAIAALWMLLPKKGLMLMSISVITLSLVACGGVGVGGLHSFNTSDQGPNVTPLIRVAFFNSQSHHPLLPSSGYGVKHTTVASYSCARTAYRRPYAE
ncbi:hypothetical protein NSS82_10875 [Paenibacillus sp. FSL H7-0735]|uniref:hypothetical protein n=1 Tax=Paenibacillus sp. FSL H7-0735 TaxID=2954736 RepID=UPI0030F4B6E9